MKKLETKKYLILVKAFPLAIATAPVSNAARRFPGSRPVWTHIYHQTMSKVSSRRDWCIECVHVSCVMRTSSPEGSSAKLLSLTMDEWGCPDSLGLTTAISDREPGVDITVSGWSVSSSGHWGHLHSSNGVLGTYIILFLYCQGRVIQLYLPHQTPPNISPRLNINSLHSLRGLKVLIIDLLRKKEYSLPHSFPL